MTIEEKALNEIQKQQDEAEEYLEEVNAFADRVKTFFIFFDGLILSNAKAEDLLNETKKSLQQKINHAESLLPVIIATGANYDSRIDRAKVEQITALEGLIKARRNLLKEIEKNQQKKDRIVDVLKMLGL